MTTPTKPTSNFADTVWREHVEKRMAENEAMNANISESLRVNTALTSEILKSVKPIVKLYEELATGTKFMCRLAWGVSWALKMFKDNWPIFILLTSILSYFFGANEFLKTLIIISKKL